MTDRVIHTLELGRVYEEQGYFKKAGDHFSGALESDPENPVLIAALDRINARKNQLLKTDFIDSSSLPGIIEQWAHLIILRQRMTRLAHRLER